MPAVSAEVRAEQEEEMTRDEEKMRRWSGTLGPRALLEQVRKMSDDEAASAVDAFFQRVPELEQWFAK